VEREDLSLGGCQAAQARMRDIETIESELRLVAALRRAARERGGPLPSITVELSTRPFLVISVSRGGSDPATGSLGPPIAQESN
jgi:hypothetical protein